MSKQTKVAPRPSPVPGRVGLAALLIVLAVLAAYGNALHGPFIFDDLPAIRDNVSIRRLWPLSGPLSPPPGTGGGDGRPLVNLSFAVNYALGGLDVRGYHVFNILLHAAVALALFGLVRRTLLLPACGPRLRGSAGLLAAVTALLWAVHPLLSESVTCTVQRNEPLVALCLLLTLYALARSAAARRPALWLALSVACCLAGMACKELMVVAPVAAFLYDRAFIAGSLAAAWRARWRYYLALAATWILLAWLVAGADRRSGTAGFGLSVGPWEYLLTQCRAIVLYLRLALWPQPLVVDYGMPVVHHLTGVLPQALLLTGLGGATGWALWRHPKAGWVAFCFFAILSPSSSFIPLVTQTIAEHRMYLPLAVLVIGAVLGLHAWRGPRAVWVLVALIPVLMFATLRRNRDYRSALELWTRTVADCPDNPRAHNNLGNAYVDLPGRMADAVEQFATAVRLKPDFIEALNNLGNAIMLSDPARLSEAMGYYETALRLNPDYAQAHNNLGQALSRLPDRKAEAIRHYEIALRLRPFYPETYFNLGLALASTPGGAERALAAFDLAISQDPGLAEARYQRANVLLSLPGRLDDAIAGYEDTLRMKPDYPQAHHNLGTALARIPGKLAAAAGELEEAARLDPGYFSAFYNLGLLYQGMPGHGAQAVARLERAVVLRPDSTAAQEALAHARAAEGMDR